MKTPRMTSPKRSNCPARPLSPSDLVSHRPPLLAQRPGALLDNRSRRWATCSSCKTSQMPTQAHYPRETGAASAQPVPQKSPGARTNTTRITKPRRTLRGPRLDLHPRDSAQMTSLLPLSKQSTLELSVEHPLLLGAHAPFAAHERKSKPMLYR